MGYLNSINIKITLKTTDMNGRTKRAKIKPIKNISNPLKIQMEQKISEIKKKFEVLEMKAQKQTEYAICPDIKTGQTIIRLLTIVMQQTQ